MTGSLILISIAILIMLTAIEFLKKEIENINEKLDRLSMADLDILRLERTAKKHEDEINKIKKLNERINNLRFRINKLILLNGLKEM